MKVSVLGAGSWGTALAVLLCENGHEVTLWSIDKREVEMIDAAGCSDSRSNRCDK